MVDAEKEVAEVHSGGSVAEMREGYYLYCGALVRLGLSFFASLEIPGCSVLGIIRYLGYS